MLQFYVEIKMDPQNMQQNSSTLFKILLIKKHDAIRLPTAQIVSNTILHTVPITKMMFCISYKSFINYYVHPAINH